MTEAVQLDGRKLMVMLNSMRAYSRWMDTEKRYETWEESVKQMSWICIVRSTQIE